MTTYDPPFLKRDLKARYANQIGVERKYESVRYRPYQDEAAREAQKEFAMQRLGLEQGLKKLKVDEDGTRAGSRLTSASSALLKQARNAPKSYISSVWSEALKVVNQLDNNFTYDGKFYYLNNYPIPIGKTQMKTANLFFLKQFLRDDVNLETKGQMLYHWKCMKLLRALNSANRLMDGILRQKARMDNSERRVSANIAWGRKAVSIASKYFTIDTEPAKVDIPVPNRAMVVNTVAELIGGVTQPYINYGRYLKNKQRKGASYEQWRQLQTAKADAQKVVTKNQITDFYGAMNDSINTLAVYDNENRRHFYRTYSRPVQAIAPTGARRNEQPIREEPPPPNAGESRMTEEQVTNLES